MALQPWTEVKVTIGNDDLRRHPEQDPGARFAGSLQGTSFMFSLLSAVSIRFPMSDVSNELPYGCEMLRFGPES